VSRSITFPMLLQRRATAIAVNPNVLPKFVSSGPSLPHASMSILIPTHCGR
jgi:hypothetical protein